MLGARLLAAMLASIPPIAFAAPLPANVDQAACERTTVLEPVVSTATDARAYWFDRATIRWPGMPLDGRYRLYHSARGRLDAKPGARVRGADGFLSLQAFEGALAPAVASAFKFVAAGVDLQVAGEDRSKVASVLRSQAMLVREDEAGRVVDATYLQTPGALDDLYAAAEDVHDLGATPTAQATTFRVWAPTARSVDVCLHAGGAAVERLPMQRDAATGTWTLRQPGDASGAYYTYRVEVFVPGVGRVAQVVTDPYSVSLDADSRRSYVADLDAPALKPDGWDDSPTPDRVAASVDMAIYELHVRDFSIGDASVSAANRGKYAAFTELDSNGMRHLRALSDAGLTDVHLLPVFDLASVPEVGCVTPEIPDAAPSSEAQQAAVTAVASRDCFNWGYDPYHFNAPEGSYASDASDGARRIVEFRRMVQALHGIGLRVGMDVVYNHTSASGQGATSVLDRIVPGYYQRLDANGKVERSTCCDNTATEHRMMAKLMIDSAEVWARHYRIDSFRFDLMGHQPRGAMEALRTRVEAATGRRIDLIGEGWNFGEVADGKRFVQASQGSLAGSGIGTFSDRARDALRGGGPSDRGATLVAQKGWLNGLASEGADATGAMHAADLVRVGLAGTLRDFRMRDARGVEVPLSGVDYKGQPAGYASEPGEVVNYVENHDNQTLFDIDVFKLPVETTAEERARVQVLALATTALSQGVAYFHAGVELLRSKSLDRNSFDSGDWFNRLDWTARDNHFGTGLPPRADNGDDYALMKPWLERASIKPAPAQIAWTRDAFLDLLRIRASSTLFRMRTASDVQRRLTFENTGPKQVPGVVVGHIEGDDYPGARFREVLYLLNADTRAHTLVLPTQRGKRWVLHPVQAAPTATDTRVKQATYRAAEGRFEVPARTVVVYVLE